MVAESEVAAGSPAGAAGTAEPADGSDAAAAATSSGPGRAFLAMGIAAVVLAVVIVVVASAAGGDPDEVELVVPAGTAAAVDRGEVVDGIPDVVELSVGDELVVDNRDSRPHTVGPVSVGPGEEDRVLFDEEGRVTIAVTIHPRRTLTVVVSD